ncbi:hypothetical protein B8W99_19920 [Peribacillus simplex]|nr:hypothetical protein CHI08_06160 [Peribacillus simplex]PAL10041.1 hypothetical protein B8W99_19920 [Peribacillus simplex]
MLLLIQDASAMPLQKGQDESIHKKKGRKIGPFGRINGSSWTKSGLYIAGKMVHPINRRCLKHGPI